MLLILLHLLTLLIWKMPSVKRTLIKTHNEEEDIMPSIRSTEKKARKRAEIPRVKTIRKKSSRPVKSKLRNFLKPTQSPKFDRNSLLPQLYGKLVKKPPQNGQIVQPGDEQDAMTTWVAFDELLTDASDKMSEKSRTTQVPLQKKPGQQDGPFDLEPLVTHLGQMIAAGEFDKFSPPGAVGANRIKLDHAMRFFRKARLSLTKFRYVDLMVNCDVYVSALMEVAGKGMLRAPLIVAKCRRYLEAARLTVVDPLPP